MATWLIVLLVWFVGVPALFGLFMIVDAIKEHFSPSPGYTPGPRVEAHMVAAGVALRDPVSAPAVESIDDEELRELNELAFASVLDSYHASV